MLRNRSRNLTGKQSLMADHNSVPSPRSNQTKPISSFFGSPINGLFSKGNNNVFGAETVMSPTSILDNQTVSNFGNPFGYYDQKKSESQKTSSSSSSAVNKQFNEKLHSKGIYLALIDSTNDEKNHDNFNFTKPKLKIQILTFPSSGISPTRSTKSPADFGIKTWNRNLSTFGGLNSCVTTMDSSNISTGGLSLSEMELSEEYTCVISRGPNPKTTRIYDNCILESCCGGVALSELKKEFNSPSKSFISFCHTCKKNLGDGKDIYMYRGEKAFCSNECRCKEML